MDGLTILMVLHNEIEYAKFSLQSIRLFADVENLSVVMIDNHLDDKLADWAKAQEDITYVYMDEGEMPFGKMLNEVCNGLRIKGDLLVMDAYYMLTPHALSRLQAGIYQDDTIGAAGGLSNSFSLFQKVSGIDNYEAAVRWGDRECSVQEGKRVLGLNSSIIYLKAAVISQMGAFDEELFSQESVMKDYCFRMLMNDWKLKVYKEALFWDVRGNGPYHSDSALEKAIMEKKWGMHYFNSVCNVGLIDMIDRNREDSIRVLEIGCDCGATLLEIRNRFPNAIVYGSEINEEAAKVASHIAHVQVNNIEEENLSFERGFFDYIIFGDVLEHLHEPLKTIQYCKGFLKKEGCIIASIPNLMHISIMEKLLKGDFTYTETGLLDKTHIHFFTFNEILRLFEAGGYKVENVKTVIYPVSIEQGELIDRLLELQSGASRFMYETFQYDVYAGAE